MEEYPPLKCWRHQFLLAHPIPIFKITLHWSTNGLIKKIFDSNQRTLLKACKYIGGFVCKIILTIYEQIFQYHRFFIFHAIMSIIKVIIII